jgi:hypothetical protein
MYEFGSYFDMSEAFLAKEKARSGFLGILDFQAF